MNTSTAILPETGIKLATTPLELILGGVNVKLPAITNLVANVIYPIIDEIVGGRDFQAHLNTNTMKDGSAIVELDFEMLQGPAFKVNGMGQTEAHATIEAFKQIIPQLERTYQYHPVGYGPGI